MSPSKTTTSKSVSKSTSKSRVTEAAKAAAEKPVTFEYFAPEARAVAVAGSFNGWSPSTTNLKKDRSGKWTVSLPLPPGQHQYRFVVDGLWQNDQRSVQCVQNPFGSWNCVIEVSGDN